MEMNKLEMLTAREQLMEDIDCIINNYFEYFDVNYDEELVKILCDAVCRNFPANWYKLMNREQLQDAYINEIIDGMDNKDMMALLFDMLDKEMDIYTDKELKEEVKNYYPHLLEEWYKPCGSSLYSRSAARPVGKVAH